VILNSKNLKIEEFFSLLNKPIYSKGILNIDTNINNFKSKNINGNLVWRGAETNEMFSFGPDISTLSFDGNLYQYDENGRLVPSQNGLKPAQVYKNRILQNSIKNSNNLTLNTALKIADLQLFSMKLDLGNSKENSIFRNNYISTLWAYCRLYQIC
jgi:hypothetical protein